MTDETERWFMLGRWSGIWIGVLATIVVLALLGDYQIR